MHILHVEDNALLWRYLDLEKFRSILDSRSIYCPKASRFEDPWEGRLPKDEDEQYVQDLVSKLQDLGILDDASAPEIERAVGVYRKSDLAFDRIRYVSCWHMNDFESAAMWDLYSRRDAGIAIVTSGRALKELAWTHRDQGAMFAAVEYLDYQKEKVVAADRDPSFCKRKSFEHEHEARLVCFPSMERVSETHIAPRDAITLPIDLDAFIDRILVSPTASDDFEADVRRLADNAKLSVPITKSDLYAPY